MPEKMSIYTLNKKDPEAIVYTDSDKRIIRLTRADFETEEDFLKWKAWSDDDYHLEEKRDHLEDNHTASLPMWLEQLGASDGPETILEMQSEHRRRERDTAEMVLRIKSYLTEKQFRRLWMYFVEGMTEDMIAVKEQRSQQAISKSIVAARKKVFRFFSESCFRGCKTSVFPAVSEGPCSTILH